MTLRDWFAGQAIVGILSSMSSKDVSDALCKRASERSIETEEYMALGAYAVADAMLAERGKP